VQKGQRSAWGKLLGMGLGAQITGGKARIRSPLRTRAHPPRAHTTRTSPLRHHAHPLVCRPAVTRASLLWQVRMMISGAAPLPLHVHEFLVAACGCAVMQGYGMTENCANATLELVGDNRAGHVGPPVPTVEIKLVDVPEMEYTTAANQSGEVCTRSVCNFAGYHKNKEETDKVLEPDGWLHTGDIGRWNADGTLSIIDRKKNIFKLSQGEYVAAEKIEMVCSMRSRC
jgi:long-chain acyl-CoA synthetase